MTSKGGIRLFRSTRILLVAGLWGGSLLADTFSVTPLVGFGGTLTMPVSINDSGQVTGYSMLSDQYHTHAFLYSGGAMSDLGTLGGTYNHSSGSGSNNLRQVVGSSYFMRLHWR
jgi:probable HAF family extracellular repeat protein